MEDELLGEDWMALESNPEVINSYIEKLGVNASQYSFNDLYDTEEETLLAMSGRTLGALLIFPLDKKYFASAKSQAAEIKEKGQYVSDKVYYMKQIANNACGTIAIIHAALNQQGDRLDVIREDSLLGNLYKNTLNMTPEERAMTLVKDINLKDQHVDAVNKGETQTQEQQEASKSKFTPHHFVCLVPKDNVLYELDGCKDFPINHGPTQQSTLLIDIMRVFREFLSNSDNEYSFSILLLQKNE